MSKTHTSSKLLPSIGAVIMAEVVAVIIFVSLSFFTVIPLNWILGVVVLVAGIILIKVGSLTIAERCIIAFRYVIRSKSSDSYQPHHIFETSSGSSTIGMLWEGDTVVTALQLRNSDVTPQAIGSKQSAENSAINLAHLAQSMKQFDIELDTIEIITSGYKSWGVNAPAQHYRSFLGSTSTVSQRDTWLVLKLNQAENKGPIARRGGGQQGTIRTMALATRRVASQLNTHHISAHIVPPAQLRRFSSIITDGLPQEAFTEHWNSISNGFYGFTYEALPPQFFSTQALNTLWTVPSQSTMLGIKLKRQSNNTIVSQAVVRFAHVNGRKESLSHSYSLAGRQRQGQHFISPLNSEHIPLDLPIFHLGDIASFQSINVPISGSGQVLGVNQDNHPTAMHLIGNGIKRVDIAADPQIVKQLLVRSMALGAKVLVRTHRLSDWKNMSDAINNPQDFLIIPADAVEYAREIIDNFTCVVSEHDVLPVPVSSHITKIIVHPQGTPLEDQPTDVAIEQAANVSSMVRVRTGTKYTWIKLQISSPELQLTGV